MMAFIPLIVRFIVISEAFGIFMMLTRTITLRTDSSSTAFSRINFDIELLKCHVGNPLPALNSENACEYITASPIYVKGLVRACPFDIT